MRSEYDMLALRVACALGAIALGGCTFRLDDGGSIPDGIDREVQQGIRSATALPTSCRPTAAAELDDLYDLTEASVHELITCGGIQMQVAMSMKLMILTSNEELISASARADLRTMASAVGLTVDNPFQQAEDGAWTMDTGRAGSTFSLAFTDPDSGARVFANPFALESYLLGVTATSSRTWSEMKADPTARTRFTYDWTETGPLAHLLADGGPIPNPIVLELSLVELGGGVLGFSEVDYGPFASTQNLLVESSIHMVDERGGASIAYDVRGRQSTVRQLVESRSLGFDIDSLVSTTGKLALHGDTHGLAYVGRGTLAGEIHYRATGTETSVRVISDFGGGMAYPTPRWECR
jgi:hypothetical protein